jgi:hypothetical protein
MKAVASLPFLDRNLRVHIRFATSNSVPCRQCLVPVCGMVGVDVSVHTTAQG